ncbi:MAG TPA: hypothetical protein VN181_10055 [Thermoanaerobaculia bacterium]|nr:hypothetical protein [Thermoanaerobaculia bacterium]
MASRESEKNNNRPVVSLVFGQVGVLKNMPIQNQQKDTVHDCGRRVEPQTTELKSTAKRQQKEAAQDKRDDCTENHDGSHSLTHHHLRVVHLVKANPAPTDLPKPAV